MSQENRPPTDRQLIFAIDDEPNILSALRRCLRAAGAEILVFESPEEALAAMASREPDLIISDMRMPGMDGAEFLAKARLARPQALRILLTGHADYSRAMSAVNDGGIWRHLGKPWDDKELFSCVQQALRMRAMAAEKRQLEELTRRQRDELAALNQSLEAKVKERSRELSEANAKLAGNFSTLVKILSGVVDARFSSGRGHRVAEIARRSAIQLNMTVEDCSRVQRAALLHLLGLVSLPDEIIGAAKDALTREQALAWRSYPASGEDLLFPLEELRPEAAIIRSHCERFDGAGFPDRMAGEAIPVGSRLLASAIAFDEALGPGSLDDRAACAKAASAIMRHAGKSLCPKACEAILAALGVKANLESLAEPMEERQEEALGCGQLAAGMRLSRDCMAPSGALLLAAGQCLTQAIIGQLVKFEERHNKALRFWICAHLKDDA